MLSDLWLMADAVVHQYVQTQCLWLTLEIIFACLSPIGTSGELGGIRQIKIEPDELDIIQITVPGGHRAPCCFFLQVLFGEAAVPRAVSRPGYHTKW